MKEDTPLGEDRRKLILGFIDAVRTYILNSHADKRFIEELDEIQRRIEGANVIETYFKDWGIQEHHETGEVFHRARANVKLNFKKRDIKNKHRFQVSAIPLALGIFTSYLYSIQQAKVAPLDISHAIIYISIGFIIVTIFYIFYTFSIYFFAIRISSKYERNFLWEAVPVLVLVLLINTLFYSFVFFDGINIYYQISPYFLKLMVNWVKLRPILRYHGGNRRQCWESEVRDRGNAAPDLASFHRHLVNWPVRNEAPVEAFFLPNSFKGSKREKHLLLEKSSDACSFRFKLLLIPCSELTEHFHPQFAPPRLLSPLPHSGDDPIDQHHW